MSATKRLQRQQNASRYNDMIDLRIGEAVARYLSLHGVQTPREPMWAVGFDATGAAGPVPVGFVPIRPTFWLPHLARGLSLTVVDPPAGGALEATIHLSGDGGATWSDAMDVHATIDAGALAGGLMVQFKSAFPDVAGTIGDFGIIDISPGDMCALEIISANGATGLCAQFVTELPQQLTTVVGLPRNTRMV